MDWPHAPLHRFCDAPSTYFVTAATYLKQHFYRSRASLDALQEHIFLLAQDYSCWLQAWSIFSNHYHLVASAERGGQYLREMLARLHSEEAIAINARDQAKVRKVWFQFRETQLTYERSWMARLRYTHENAVHHGLVLNAANYRWCSARGSSVRRESPSSSLSSVSRSTV